MQVYKPTAFVHAMKEDFLHYLWRYSKFDNRSLTAVDGKRIAIVHPGQYLQVAGPDFFNAQVVIDGQKWAGNVEIHVKSSDWYLHRHERDPAYVNVVLHVVWEHDTAVFRGDNSEIPTLELRPYTDSRTLEAYRKLSAPKDWIYCERQIADTDAFRLSAWLERLFFERLERKAGQVKSWKEFIGSDWEALLFRMLARNFGLNHNAEAFSEMSLLLPFSVVRKERKEVLRLEALFMGICGLLDESKEDQYHRQLQGEFRHLSQKYGLDERISQPVQFFKLRPDNFPTLRLSQLAALYQQSPNLFAAIVAASSSKELHRILRASATPYWETHYLFDRPSARKKKEMSGGFIDLLIINTIVPLRFLYGQARGDLTAEELVTLLRELRPESNAIIEKFVTLGIVAGNAFESQALLQLKSQYCANARCLECAVGDQLLKTN